MTWRVERVDDLPVAGHHFTLRPLRADATLHTLTLAEQTGLFTTLRRLREQYRLTHHGLGIRAASPLVVDLIQGGVDSGPGQSLQFDLTTGQVTIKREQP